MDLAPWRSLLARARHRNRSRVDSRYLQLATVTPDGKPANRTVVFRGFLTAANALTFVTDARSDKVRHLQHFAWGEACWYFTQTREQFRLAGSLIVVDHHHPNPNLAEERIQGWSQLSDQARQQFTWPEPGASRASATAFAAIPHPTVPPDHFCLLVLTPEWVDHLELRGDPQNRTQYFLQQDSWCQKIVNP